MTKHAHQQKRDIENKQLDDLMESKKAAQAAKAELLEQQHALEAAKASETTTPPAPPAAPQANAKTEVVKPQAPAAQPIKAIAPAPQRPPVASEQMSPKDMSTINKPTAAPAQEFPSKSHISPFPQQTIPPRASEANEMRRGAQDEKGTMSAFNRNDRIQNNPAQGMLRSPESLFQPAAFAENLNQIFNMQMQFVEMMTNSWRMLLSSSLNNLPTARVARRDNENEANK